MKLALGAVSLAWLLSGSGPLVAATSRMQQVSVISDEVSCPDCGIELQQLAVLAPPDSVLAFPILPLPSVARDGQGRYLSGPMSGDAVIAVFDRHGAFGGGRGRQGGGPTEFAGMPLPMIIRELHGDSLLVVQGTYMHLLGPAATTTLAKVQTRLAPNDVAVLEDALVFQSYVRYPPGPGTPLQIVTREGDVVKGFGARSDDQPSGRGYFVTARTVAASMDRKTLWSSYVNSYELSQWDIEGNELARVVRRSTWFEPYTQTIAGEIFSVPQRPRVAGVFDSGSGRLWVAVTQADRDFKPVLDLNGRAEARLDPAEIDFNALLDTTLELLDLEAQSVVVRQTFDGYLRFVDAPGADRPVLFMMKRDELGRLSAVVYEARISM